MRNRNVFGKKITRANVLVLFALIFALVFGVRVFLLNSQAAKLSQMQADRLSLEREIARILNQQESQVYHAIPEIIQYLPNTFNQSKTAADIERVRNLSNLALASNYRLTFNYEQPSPFPANAMPSTVRTVTMSLSFTASNAADILVFLINLDLQDQFYYISNLNVVFQVGGSASFSMTFHTFYNQVNV